MRIGIPKEIKESEGRVALPPAYVGPLVRDGHDVWVEQSAGRASGFEDTEFVKVGAKIEKEVQKIFSSCDMVVKVKEPLEPEFPMLLKGQILYTYLHLAASKELTKKLLATGCIAIAYETIEMEDHFLPVLAPMSGIAGRLAVQMGAHHLEAYKGGRGVLLGGMPGVLPATVLILGAGVVGTNATKIAHGMGARVIVVDIDTKKMEQIENLYTGVDTLFSTRQNIADLLPQVDLLVGAVLITGAKAPHLVTRDMLPLMPRGSVIVDVSVDQGGCVETTKPTTHTNPTYVIDGVIHYGVANMPGAVPRTSSLALSNASFPWARAMANKGLTQALKDNPALQLGVNVWEGQLTCKPVADSLALKYTPLDKVLR